MKVSAMDTNIDSFKTQYDSDKSLLRTNLATKGVSSQSSDSLTTLAGKVLQIPSLTPPMVFQDPCTPSTHFDEYGVHTDVTMTQETNGIKVSSSRADRQINLPYYFAVAKDYEWSYTYTTPNNPQIAWTFMINGTNQRLFGIDVENQLLKYRWGGNTYTNVDISSYNLADGDKIKVTKVGSSWSVYINNNAVVSNLSFGISGQGFYIQHQTGLNSVTATSYYIILRDIEVKRLESD